MPKYSKDYQEYLKSRIRNILVVNPRASLRQIRTNLENSPTAPITIDLEYIGKLRDKIIKERAVRNDRATRNRRIAELQDKKERIDQQLWQEAIAQDNPGKTRVQALSALLKNDLDLLSAEMDAGVFERNLGVMEHVPKPLSAEQRARAVEVLATWGIVKKPSLNDQKQLPQTDNSGGSEDDSGGSGVEKRTA